MPRLVYDPETVRDFDRIFDHFARHDPVVARETIGHIVEAMKILVTSPLLGRPTAGGKRELVIGRGTRGFVALYRYLPREAEIATEKAAWLPGEDVVARLHAL